MKKSPLVKRWRWHKPHWVLTLLVIIFTPFLLSLAYWQWQRALEKEKIIAEYALTDSMTAVPLVDITSPREYQPVIIEGHFDIQHLFFLDNVIYKSRAGFEVLIPFQLKNQDWVLVNLGWVPRRTQRRELPTLPAIPEGNITLEGRIELPAEQYLLLGTYLEPVSDTQTIIQAIDIDRLRAFLGHSLLPMMVLAAPKPENAFVRDWNPKNMLTPSTHYGYAVQWLLLAMTLMILYIVYSSRPR